MLYAVLDLSLCVWSTILHNYTLNFFIRWQNMRDFQHDYSYIYTAARAGSAINQTQKAIYRWLFTHDPSPTWSAQLSIFGENQSHLRERERVKLNNLTYDDEIVFDNTI